MLPPAASAQFSGTFELSPTGCEEKGLCTLTYNLKYEDPKGIEWQADAQDETDGASIPPWAQPIIGKPFDSQFIKAAAIHDHYCVRQVRPWRQTHRVFYDALLEVGVDDIKAKIMYYAVYLGGPKWVKLTPGKNCGKSCINSFKSGASAIQSRAADYDSTGFTEDLQQVEQLLIKSNGMISLGDLEKRAQIKRPNDFYFQNGDVVETNTGLPTQ